jgi:hypothetical protein
MVASLARTMKVGPEPVAMCWWKISGIERMDEREARFRTAEGRLRMAEPPMAKALHFYRCGLYDVVRGEGAAAPGLHLIEFFDPGERSREELRDSFGAREREDGRLVCLLSGIGLPAPPPGGLALWTFASYAAGEPFFRIAPPPSCGVREAGLYRNFGDDIPQSVFAFDGIAKTL